MDGEAEEMDGLIRLFLATGEPVFYLLHRRGLDSGAGTTAG